MFVQLLDGSYLGYVSFNARTLPHIVCSGFVNFNERILQHIVYSEFVSFNERIHTPEHCILRVLVSRIRQYFLVS